MKIFVKTLAGAQISLEVGDDLSIVGLKQLMASEHGYSLDGMKLIFKGKVLNDEVTLKEAAVVENEFFVIVGKKAAVAPQKPVEEPKRAEPEPPKPEPTPVQAPPSPAPATPPVQPQPQPAQTAPAAPHTVSDDAASAFLMGDALEGMVASIVDMGFPREEVLRAMRAAFNNPDRAVEYLMTGNIPADVPRPAPAQPAAPQAAQAGGAPAPQQTPNPADLEAMLQQYLQQESGQSELEQALASIPNFNQIRGMIAANPQLLQSVMQTLQAQSPELFQLIQQNPQEFLRILREGVPTGQGAPGQPEAPAGRAPPPGTITVTPEEKAAIDRLASLGFPEALAAEAYLVCGKNEELAANYLFERADEFGRD